MELGVVLDVLWPFPRIERLARSAQESGFDQIWVSDHPLGHDPFLVVHKLAVELPEIRLGIGTVSPSARHPAVLAASAGFLNELTDGRLSLGIGSSIKPLLQPIGLDVAGQVTRCREAIVIIRQLLEEGVSTHHGSLFTTREARALFDGARPLPVLVGASGGPAILRMSGEVAHGVIIPAGNRGFYEYAVGRYREALAAAGRPGPGQVVLNGNISVADSTAAAVDAIRPLVADAIAHRAENSHSLRHLGITAEQAAAWRADPDSIPETVVRESAIAGTPDECVQGLLELSRWGITQLALRFPDESAIRAVGERVLPRIKQALPVGS